MLHNPTRAAPARQQRSAGIVLPRQPLPWSCASPASPQLPRFLVCSKFCSDGARSSPGPGRPVQRRVTNRRSVTGVISEDAHRNRPCTYLFLGGRSCRHAAASCSEKWRVLQRTKASSFVRGRHKFVDLAAQCVSERRSPGALQPSALPSARSGGMHPCDPTDPTPARGHRARGHGDGARLALGPASSRHRAPCTKLRQVGSLKTKLMVAFVYVFIGCLGG